MPIPEHIRRIADRFLAGEATAEEQSVLDAWYQSFDDAVVEIPAGEDASPEALGQRMRHRLIHSISAGHQAPVVRRRMDWKKAAAAILLLVGIGAALRMIAFSGDASAPWKGNAVKVSEAPLLPGSDRAWLRLADGSVIYLDSTAPGDLTSQGGLRLLKTLDGQIVYQANASSQAVTEAPVYNEISTPRGGQYQIILSDGTHVWLNAATSFRFPVNFPGGERRVSLRGEAYFEVATDTEKPFRVEATGCLVEVYGTHFNVNAYADESTVRTTLLEGRVGVGTDRQGADGRLRLLEPGQQSAVSPDGSVRVDPRADTEEAVAWKNGRFQFNSADLGTIMRQVARWYDAEVVFEGSPDLHFTGQITRNDEVKKVLDMMEMTGEVRFRMEGRRIHVSRQ